MSTGHLPRELHDQARAVLRAAWKLGAEDGKARIEQFASWVEKQHPGATGSLREGLAEMFTVSEIGLTPALRRCLGTTNVIDKRPLGHAPPNWPGHPVERRVHGGALGRGGVPGGFEKGYRRIMGYNDLWMLKAHLEPARHSPG